MLSRSINSRGGAGWCQLDFCHIIEIDVLKWINVDNFGLIMMILLWFLCRLVPLIVHFGLLMHEFL